MRDLAHVVTECNDTSAREEELLADCLTRIVEQKNTEVSSTLLKSICVRLAPGNCMLEIACGQ